MDLLDSEDSHKDPMNVNDLPTSPIVDAGIEAESAEDRAVNVRGQVEVCEDAPLKWEGVAKQEQSDPSSRDLLMTEANPPDLVDPMVTEEPFHQSPLNTVFIKMRVFQ